MILRISRMTSQPLIHALTNLIKGTAGLMVVVTIGVTVAGILRQAIKMRPRSKTVWVAVTKGVFLLIDG